MIERSLKKIKKQPWVLLFLLVFIHPSDAKKLKIRSCTLASGEVVLMDKACPVNSKTGQYNKPKKNQSVTHQKRGRQQAAIIQRQRQNSSKKTGQRVTQHDANKSKALSQILASVQAPEHWFVQSFSIPKGDAITVSPKRLIRPNALKTGATIQRFTNTVKHFKKDAFSVAIDKFHAIRFDEKSEMTESEFIAHEKYKVFNVHYQKERLRQSTLKVIVQFYVDERNDDLYVLQFKAPTNHWSRLKPIKDRLFSRLKL